MGHTRNVPQGAVFSKRHWYHQRHYRMLRYGGPWELIWSALATVTQMSYGDDIWIFPCCHDMEIFPAVMVLLGKFTDLYAVLCLMKYCTLHVFVCVIRMRYPFESVSHGLQGIALECCYFGVSVSLGNASNINTIHMYISRLRAQFKISRGVVMNTF